MNAVALDGSSSQPLAKNAGRMLEEVVSDIDLFRICNSVTLNPMHRSHEQDPESLKDQIAVDVPLHLPSSVLRTLQRTLAASWFFRIKILKSPSPYKRRAHTTLPALCQGRAPAFGHPALCKLYIGTCIVIRRRRFMFRGSGPDGLAALTSLFTIKISTK